MNYYIIGTAGHVDHGKTQLIKALTGEDTDRLKEEKERGISIELGFASLALPSGAKAGVVDVPGHEKFVRQMLAGIGGIDLVLLVIAADEGVMPQTREHLEIIDLLQIKQGLVVLSKVDLMDQEWRDLVKLEIEEALQGSVLAGSEIVEVSALSGEGLERLAEVLDEELAKLPPRKVFGPCRMPIDRVFSIAGFGTVVTGTVFQGSIKVGQAVSVEPGGLESRIRSIQVHGAKVDSAYAGQRAAVNLPDLEVADIPKGANVLSPNYLFPVQTLDLSLRYLASSGSPLLQRQRVRFHIGTKEVFGRVHLLDREEVEPGTPIYAQILLEEPVIAARGDKFVIRRYSPAHTIGGGIVLDCGQRKYKRYNSAVLDQLAIKEKGTPEELVYARLQVASQPLQEEEIVKGTGLGAGETGATLVALGDKVCQVRVEEGQNYWFGELSHLQWGAEVNKSLLDFHRNYAFRPGLSKEEIKSKFFSGWNGKLFSAFLGFLQQHGEIVVSENFVSLPDFVPGPPTQLVEAVNAIVEEYEKSEMAPPDWETTAASLRIKNPLAEEVLQFLLRKGKLVKVAPNLYFSFLAVDRAEKALSKLLTEQAEFSPAEARERLNTSRKYLIPLLEYFDRKKLTRRVNEKRTRF